MNRGLLIKSLREAWIATVLFALALMVVEGVLAYVLPTFYDDFTDHLFQVKIIQTAMRALLGTELGDTFGQTTIIAMAWAHTVVLTIVWAHAIIFCTRVPAGEIDRGTIDLLFGLPVSRWHIYRCESAVFLVTGLIVISMGLLGNVLGSLSQEPDSRPDLSRSVVIVVNLLCLYLAVGGLAFLISSLANHRGRAVAVVFAILLASFLLNFLAQLWQPAEKLSFLSVLNYYQPLVVLRQAGWPTMDLAVLTGLAATLWIIGGLCFARRDICTV